MAKLTANRSLDYALIAGFILSASVLVPPFVAQTTSSTRVLTTPDPVQYYVDGQIFYSGSTFNWPAGSKHTLSVDPIETGAAGTRYTFRGWSAGVTPLAAGNSITVTADPAIPTFTAAFDKLISVNVAYYDCAPDAGDCISPGTVVVNGTVFKSSAQVWVQPGSNVSLQAYPNSGYVFTGWSIGTQTITGFIGSMVVNQPTVILALFAPSRNVTVTTDPPNLQVAVDHTQMSAPAALQWGRGTMHLLGTSTPQFASDSRWYAFSSWSDGGAMNHTYKVADSDVADTVTAKFVPAGRVTLATTPPMLNLLVDGQTPAPPYNFIWTIGDRHHIEAPARQVDAQGRVWVFQSWSDAPAAAFDMTVPQVAYDPTGYRVTATYTQMARMTISTNLAAAVPMVDGVACASPCAVERQPGTKVTVSVAQTISLGDNSRADFDSWSNGGTSDQVLTATLDAQQVTANYRTLNRLVLAADPSTGAVCVAQPASPDGYYPTGTNVSVTATVQPGYRFKRWDGDVSAGSASASTATLSLTSPRFARAVLDRVPYVAPAGGVHNVAGDGTATAVAPGSIVNISGVNLVSDVVTGPDNPLSQTLGNVTVRIGDLLLPLISVAPDHITAQLPPDLSEGTASLWVRVGGGTELRADFTSTPKAPGLLSTPADGHAWAVAAHADGTLVTTDKPATRGEVVTLYGTGFGATTPLRPLGFAVPDSPDYVLVDLPQLRLGDAAVPVDAAFAAPGRAGVDAVRFRVPDSLDAAAFVAIVATSGGNDSNAVQLPIQ